MKRIGIVICNYNKSDYIVQCIASVLDSTYQDFDVYVVDNASTDDSVKRIQKKFQNQIVLIQNKENLGGSGGFNTGLREALKKDYVYLMCVDNDVFFDKNAIGELYQYLEEHPEAGMAGSKCFYMDEPEKIWNYGGIIDFEGYVQKDLYKNQKDTDDIPETVACDYVPACSMMVRTSAVRKVGIMPEDNFIYWDDMEWGYRFHKAGYKVVAVGKARVWHKAGGRNSGNTFIHYYMWRNRIYFFMNVLKEDEKGKFTEEILSEMFRMIYSVNLKGEVSIVKTLMFAFDDAVHGVRGKAADYKILPRPKAINRVQEALGDSKNVLIKFDGNFEALGNIVKNIRGFSPKMQICIYVKDGQQRENVRKQYSECMVTAKFNPEQFDIHLIMCNHIFQLSQDTKEDIYIDPWCNIIFSKADYVYCRSFERTRQLFLLCKKDVLLMTDVIQD